MFVPVGQKGGPWQAVLTESAYVGVSGAHGSYRAGQAWGQQQRVGLSQKPTLSAATFQVIMHVYLLS